MRHADVVEQRPRLAADIRVLHTQDETQAMCDEEDSHDSFYISSVIDAHSERETDAMIDNDVDVRHDSP